jgi:hypothetical protein
MGPGIIYHTMQRVLLFTHIGQVHMQRLIDIQLKDAVVNEFMS